MPNATVTEAVGRIERNSNYDEFQMIGANRNINDSHVRALVTSFEEMGNLTRVNPILVNENMEIIDGQHRFEACRQLGLPIYFTKVPGLSIHEARSMNILQRNWTPDDWAHSYAESGNQHYRNYLSLRDTYGFAPSLIIEMVNPGARKVMKQFRAGDFEIPDLALLLQRLDMISAVAEKIDFRLNQYLARAIVRAARVEGFSLERLLRKLDARPLTAQATTEGYLRELEETYNFHMQEGSRLRLY